MAGDSTLDPDNLPNLPDQSPGHGHDIGTLGPSDTSDSGSDMQGAGHGKPVRQTDVDARNEAGLPSAEGSTSDSQGTGERASVEPDTSDRDGADIAADHVTPRE